jgi:CRISPR-associated protein Cst2
MDNQYDGQNEKAISSISICGRITLNMHSLNNEGGEGNQTLTRQVTIIDEKGEFATVNAVSGDMLKHIQAEHFWKIAVDEKLALSSACKRFSANRITESPEFTSSFEKKTPDVQVLEMLIQQSSLSDVEGILVTNNNKNVPRKSCAEFGWLIALPDKSKTENHFHVKFVSDSGTRESGTGENLGQTPFHRPANSGIYAFVANFDLSRVGYNDISKRYAISDTEREKRVTAFLKSILFSFINPNGAMRNTQNPHVVNFVGVIAVSSKGLPAPTISPINTGYDKEIEQIARNLNQLEESAIEILPFKSLAEFSQTFTALINTAKGMKLNEIIENGSTVTEGN